jgi:hypothetical protein
MLYKSFLAIVMSTCLAIPALAEDTAPRTGAGTLDDPITTHSTTDSTVTTQGNMTTTIKQPPPSAIAPQFSSGSNSDLCTIGVAGAVQTQILGISAGTTFTEENCLRLKNAKTLYDMGMKVAAVSVMCQDEGVFDAMMMAGTPCPYDGKIGEEAKIGWETHEETTKDKAGETKEGPDAKEIGVWSLGGIAALLLLL